MIQVESKLCGDVMSWSLNPSTVPSLCFKEQHKRFESTIITTRIWKNSTACYPEATQPAKCSIVHSPWCDWGFP